MNNPVIALTILMLLSGCTNFVPYHSTSRMSVKEATATLKELNNKMDRHDLIEIDEDAIKFINNGKLQHFYFNSIENVRIYNKSGYVKVYLESPDESGYVFRAYNHERGDNYKVADSIKTAKLYVDGVESLIFAYKSKHNKLTESSKSIPGSNAERLLELQSLRDKGLM